VLEGRKDLPANNLAEFIALLKQNGTKMQYRSAGVGSTTHLACALLNARIGVEVTHVPYRGGGPLANDLIGGHIDYMCGNMVSSIARATAKQSKPLALLSRERTQLMPELATAHEQGIKDYDVVTWTAFFLPKGAANDIVAKLNKATNAAMDTPAIKTRFNAIGVVGVAPERRGPEYLAKYVVEEIARWEGPIRAAGFAGGLMLVSVRQRTRRMSASGHLQPSPIHRALIRCTPETGHVGVRRACQLRGPESEIFLLDHLACDLKARGRSLTLDGR